MSLDGAHWKRRFASETCRKRKQRGTVPPPSAQVERPKTELHATALRDLSAAGRANTMLGQAALAYAARLDSTGVSDSAFTSLTEKLLATMDRALAGAPVPADPLDEIAVKRSERRAGAG